MRGRDDILAEYRELCAQLGDVALKRADLDDAEKRIRARVSELNVEMRIVTDATERPT